MHNRAEIRNVVLVCVSLAAAAIAAYWPVTHAQFVNIDDPTYIADNLRVQRGLTFDNVKWAFRTFYFSNWHPLTWLSYMLDCELFGVNPHAMHRVNLALHVANAVLLFLLLRRMTAALWPSAIVATLFSLHPLHVESVAWIAERKDVLSTLFWMLSMGAYVEYVRRRCAGWYTTSIVFLALGLMSKAMLVTLPFVLLLLDVWPLRRIDINVMGWWKRAVPLLLEKIPFFVLAGISSYVTFLAQRQGESVVSFVRLPFTERFENAVISYVRYLGKTFWPTDLAVFYPHPGEWSGIAVLAAAAVVLILSGVAVLTIRRWPFLFCGWFWYAGTLVPVIGIVQVGGQSIADRYTYVPLIGLFIAVVWGLRQLSFAPVLKRVGIAAVGTVIVVCAFSTYQQSQHWQSSLALFTHANRVTPPNAIVLNNLGSALLQEGRTNEAIQKFTLALAIEPENAWSLGNLANRLFAQGKLDEAIQHYQSALEDRPNSAELHHNIGLAFTAKGDFPEAIRHHRESLAINPFYLNARLNLGNAYLSAGDPDAAATNYLAVLALKPGHAPAHYNLGNARLAQKRLDEAIRHFGEAIRLDAKFADAHRQLGVALQQAGKPAEALPPLQKAVALSPSSPGIRAQLAALLAELGNTKAAMQEYREALKLSPDLPGVLNNLAWLLATHPDTALRNGKEAVQLAERAVMLTDRKQSLLLGTLAAAYAEVGRFDDAVKTAEQAIQLAEAKGQADVAAKNRELLGAYHQRRAWHEPVPPR